MRKILTFLFMTIVFAFGGINNAHACTANEIDVAGDGTNCQTAKFTITTTELTADTTFAFYMSAMGTFYVDWGDGTVDTITRTDTTETLYDHIYSTAGVKTIRFGGVATGYISRYNNTIRFGYGGTADSATPTLISAINGSLGEIFSVQANRVPAFAESFSRTRINEIPENLFSGIRASTPYMFHGTFAYNSALISIPANLFADITAPKQGLFNSTFMGTGVKTIPPTLFHSINGSAVAMFQNTFRSASITSIPAELFETITEPAANLFNATFMSCTRLTQIPDNLFAGITSTASNMFYFTFYGCTGLRGYIPPSLFAGLNNSGKYSTDMMTGLFASTNLDTSCPAGTVQFITGYEDYLDGHVSCVDENLICDAGEYLPAHGYECAECPENNYCAGGTYPYSETTASGATACAAGLYAPAGISNANQCGHILHIGDEVVYLHQTKKTTPSLHAKIGNDIFYGNMTTADVMMHAGSERKLKVQYNNTTYSVYDDTVTVPQ